MALAAAAALGLVDVAHASATRHDDSVLAASTTRGGSVNPRFRTPYDVLKRGVLMRRLSVRSLVPTSLVLSAACLAGNTHGPSSDERTSPKRVLSGTDTLAVESDAYLGPDGDDYWKGTTDSLVVDGVRSTRILIRANQAAIEEAIGNGTLASATLELTVQTAGASWPTGGATVDAHRVLQHWTEAEVTWVCADGHEGWDMSTGSGSIWHATHTARTTITNGQTGVVRLNVTADVAAFLNAPQSNHGWLIKRTAEGISEPGRIAFASRETTPQPRLIIEVASDTARPDVPNRDPQFTTELTVATPDGTASYHRDVLYVTFHDSTAGSTVRDVFERYSATVVGGIVRPDEEDDYIVQVPDPGATWSALQALIQAIGSEPGVIRVGAAAARTYMRVRARYPEDGAFSTRADWFRSPATVGTQPRLAIRAPLAWGCETGQSGLSRPRVAVADLLFDWQHQDFEGSTVTFDPLPVGTRRVLSNALTDVNDGPWYRAHGTGVAGILSATGDNGQGIAGMLWNSDLYLYAMAEGQDEARDLDLRLARILESSTAAGASIFITSLGIGTSADDAMVARIRSAFRRYLAGGGLVIVPTGNDGLSRTIANVAISTDTLILASDRALAQLYSTFSSQIIFVAGTNRNQTFWAAGLGNTSNYWSDAQTIAAPAELVLSLGIRSEPDAQLPGAPFGIRMFSGTSFAAPHVAGVAGQLAAMDPTLTAAEIKSYILRGAQQPKEDPTTGVIPASGDSVSRRVQGAPGPLYQLDAYGSLTLLSRERNGTPLCGVEVVYRQQTGAVIANRQAPELILSNAPAAPVNLTDGLSVAQGGRLLAIGNQAYVFQGGAWQALSPRQGVDQIIYVERDTVFLRFTASGPRIDLHARINTGAEQQLTAGLPGGLWSPGFVTGVSGASPTGDFLHFRWTYGDGDFCTLGSIGGGGEYIARLRAGGRQVLNEWSYPECASPAPISGDPEHSLVTWRRDGAEMLRAVTLLGDDSFYLKRYAATTTLSLVNTGPTYTGYIPGDIHWSPEGGRVTLRERELASSTCQLAIRAAIEPYALIEPAIALNPEACFWQPRIAPLRDQLLATVATRPASGPRGASTAAVRVAHTSPLEQRVRAN